MKHMIKRITIISILLMILIYTTAYADPTYPNKPTNLSADNSTYTGNLITANVTGYDSETMFISGNQQTNAGDYTISVTPKAGQWSDGTADAVNCTWKILPIVLQVPSHDEVLHYNGSSQSPHLTGYNSSIMNLDGDTAETNAGIYTVTVDLKENYIGNYVFDGEEYPFVNVDWKIYPETLTNGDIKITETEQPYGWGSEVITDFEVKHTLNNSLYTLIKNTDYEFTFSNNINVGKKTAVIAVTGKGNFDGTIYETFSILPVDFTPTISTTDTLTYTGIAQEPTLSVIMNNMNLVKNVDYQVTFENNKNAGTAVAHLVGINNYEGEKDFQFQISKAPITVTVSGKDKIYDGSKDAQVYATITGTVNGEVLSIEKDYYPLASFDTPDIGDNKPVTVRMYLYEKGLNYSLDSADGYYYCTASILPNVLSVDVEVESGFLYTGYEICPPVAVFVSGELISSDDYDVSYLNNKNVGTATVTVTLKNNLTGSGSATFEIEKAPSYLSFGSFDKEYDGTTSASGTVQLSALANDVLVENVDYAITNAYFADSEVGENKIVNVTVSLLNTDMAKNYYLEEMPIQILANILPKHLEFELYYSQEQHSFPDYTFNGSFIMPSFIINVSGDENYNFNPKTDYDVVYRNNFKASPGSVKPSITVTLKGDYSGSATAYFNILPKTLTATLIAEDKEYDGTDDAIVDAIISGVVTNDSFENTIDFTLENAKFSDANIGNDKVVTATMVIRNLEKANNYTFADREGNTVPLSCTASIIEKPVEPTITLTSQKDLYYDGTPKEPEIIVNYGDTILTSGDYTVTYENNINAGTATIVATLKGNYSGTATKIFTIHPKRLNRFDFEWLPITKEYDGNASANIILSITGLVNNEILEEGVDYKITNALYEDASIGEHKDVSFTIELMNTPKSNNYYIVLNTMNDTGTITIRNINAELWYSQNVQAFPDFTYNNSFIEPEFVFNITSGDNIELTKDIDYDVEYSNNKNVGTGSIEVVFKGNFAGSASTSFNIVPKALTASITAEDKEYDGLKNATVEVVVSGVASGETFVENTDFELYLPIFSDPNVGTNKDVTVTLIKINPDNMNNYVFEGEHNNRIQLSAKANIIPKTMTLNIDDINEEYIYDGLAKIPEVVVRIGEREISSGDYDLEYFDNTNAGTARVVATLKDENYNATGVKEFEIQKLPITANATFSNKVYDGTKSASVEVVFDGLLGDDSLVLDEDYEIISAEFSDANAGLNKNVTAHLGLKDTTKANNYALPVSLLNGQASILLKVLTPTIEDVEDQYYCGTEIEPAVVVKDGDRVLVSGEEYKVAYYDNKSVGTATVNVSMIGNYQGFASTTFEIKKANLEVTIIAEDKTYDGTDAVDYELSFTTVNNETLVKDVDYTIEDVKFADVNAGENIIVTGKFKLIDTDLTANYTLVQGNITGYANILPKTLTNFVNGISSQLYNGNYIEPNIVIMDGDYRLVLDTDYDVEYANNRNAGTATATVTLKGNYTGSTTKNFTINKQRLTPNAIVLDKAFDGTKDAIVTISFEGLVGSETLALGTDYEIISAEYSDANIGTEKQVTIQISLKFTAITSNYVLSISTIIAEGNIVEGVNEASILPIDSVIYDGTAQEPELTVVYGGTVLTPGEDYTVNYTNNINVGTASVEVTLQGLYEDEGTLSTTFEITKAPLGVVLVAQDKVYNGSDYAYCNVALITPDNQVLKKGVDFTISNTKFENKNIGNNKQVYATITLRDTDKARNYALIQNVYTGYASIIENADDSTTTYSGSNIVPSVVVYYGSDKLTSSVDYDTEFANNKNAGTASATVTLKGTHSGSSTVTFEIEKRILSISATANNKTYDGGKNAEVEVIISGIVSGDTFVSGTDFEIASAEFEDSNAGVDKEVIVEVIINETSVTNNYEFESGVIYCTANILPKHIEPTIDDIESVTYDGTEKTPDVVVKYGNIVLTPNIDYSVTYNNNIEVGTAEVIITLKGNYEGDGYAEFEIIAQETVLKGDLDGDGKITIYDVRLLLQNYINPAPTWSDEQLAVMDINEDGIINIYDVRMLLQIYINQ